MLESIPPDIFRCETSNGLRLKDHLSHNVIMLSMKNLLKTLEIPTDTANNVNINGMYNNTAYKKNLDSTVIPNYQIMSTFFKLISEYCITENGARILPNMNILNNVNNNKNIEEDTQKKIKDDIFWFKNIVSSLKQK